LNENILVISGETRMRGGYQFWLNKLNQFAGNFERAEMVKAFINSDEYRARFALLVTSSHQVTAL
jgi:hypothetical protein